MRSLWSALRVSSRLRTLNSQPLIPRRTAVTSAANLQFGQPLHETHPHLLGAGEGKA